MSIREYNKKRDFSKTSEPKGKVKKSDSDSLEFVIQKHHARRLHFDFRIEYKGKLVSWAIPKEPTMDPNDKRLAVKVEDHPFEYRKFEGDIPEGEYGAGHVEIWDKGTFSYPGLKFKDIKGIQQKIEIGLKKEHVVVELKGKKLNGSFSLVKIDDKSQSTNNKKQDTWLFFKMQDKYADDFLKSSYVTIESPTKIDFKRYIKKYSLKKFKNSQKLKPMLASVSEKVFDHKDWIFELKYDGYRSMAEISGTKEKKVVLHSRNGIDLSATFEDITLSLKYQPHEMIVDGEIVVLDKNGRSDFGLIKQYKNSQEGNLMYFAFDILMLDGYDLRNVPLIERKKILKGILSETEFVQYSDHINASGIKLFEIAKQELLEGIIAKKSDSKYKNGIRTKDWLKIKSIQTIDAVIIGFTKPKGGRKFFGALLLGIYEGKKLKYIGDVGSGFDDKLLENIYLEIKQDVIENPEIKSSERILKESVFVKPRLVCEVSYTEFTDEGSLRHPVFVRLRDDKDLKDDGKGFFKEVLKGVKKITIDKHVVEVSNPSKILWPKVKITKFDMVEYYKNIADYILPYLKNRPLAIKRYPDGIEGEGFFQKDIEHHPDWVETHIIHSESADRDLEYVVCQNTETLLFLANLGAVELHPWHSTIQDLDKPDYVIFDLDPKNIDFLKVKETALEFHKLLSEIECISFVKTSGSKGIHIYIPLDKNYSYDQVADFALVIASIINQKLPDITTLERSMESREGKIYIDIQQNRKGQTVVAPYSLRPKKEASISMPIFWKDVNAKLKQSDFTLKNSLKIIQKRDDPWKDFFKSGVQIEKIIKKLETFLQK